MPNYCDFSIKTVGRKEDILKFSDIINCDYFYDPEKGVFPKVKHFWRVFDSNKANDENIECCDEENGTYSFVFVGYCAWSVYSCFCDGPFTYQKDHVKNSYNMGTTLLDVSKELNLDIEVWSIETGMAFQEHFLFKQGEQLLNDCIDNVYELSIDDLIEIYDNEKASEKEKEMLQKEIDMICSQEGIEVSDWRQWAENHEDCWIVVGGSEDFEKFQI